MGHNWISRKIKQDFLWDGFGSDWGSVAQVVKEREGFDSWGLGGEGSSGNGVEICKDEEGMFAISLLL